MIAFCSIFAAPTPFTTDCPHFNLRGSVSTGLLGLIIDRFHPESAFLKRDNLKRGSLFFCINLRFRVALCECYIHK
ncbi:hypothetical protein AHF37_10901 [Paragonimus kellicotti]|nr:hypothetical protein AHF37_10901 [Paragonimus kellicotti]